MATQDTPEALRLRREAGEYVRGLRQNVGLTQREFAAKVGFPYYTVVSQIETGVMRMPVEKIGDAARALGVKPKDMAKRLLAYYEPTYFHLLFGKQPDET